jgi:hypothetical protein
LFIINADEIIIDTSQGNRMTPDLFDYLIAAVALLILAIWFEWWWRK